MQHLCIEFYGKPIFYSLTIGENKVKKQRRNILRYSDSGVVSMSSIRCDKNYVSNKRMPPLPLFIYTHFKRAKRNHAMWILPSVLDKHVSKTMNIVIPIETKIILKTKT